MRVNAAAREALHTVFNELENNDWTFDKEEPIELNFNEDRLQIQISLPSSRVITLQFSESLPADCRYCHNCGTVQPGWPSSWGNIATEKGRLQYVCARCAETANTKEPSGG